MTDFLTSPDRIVLAAGLLFFASVLANRLSDRLGVPTLLMFLGLGMIVGTDGLGLIDFDQPAVANAIGIFALVYILFSGGLTPASDGENRGIAEIRTSCFPPPAPTI